MKTFNLLEGKVELSNTKLEVTQVTNWSLLKNKFLSVAAGLYIFDRTYEKIHRGFDSLWDIILTSLLYVPLSFFVGYWLYLEFIQKSWSNSIEVAAITSITETINEENPLNITLTIQGKFNTIDLSFRKSEKEHISFLESLQKLNSRYTLKSAIV